ncbi:MAG: MarR family transcriptional regulator [Eggerthellaceae bacterium]|jgi:hypothetical protein|nr:MarR family transcriptional regulator [Eggerthellaceae bacterium]
MTLNNAESHNPVESLPTEDPYGFDFTFVHTTARIALYDDLRSAPRVVEVEPADTTQYIENLASTIYREAQQAGGTIPYTVIREVSENFIHARFREIVVSVLDRGNTIRFADQGPGIPFKDQAQKPGFSSAVEPMKKYIRGVGSGLPIVRDYLDISHGNISIEDNLGQGSVVTISVTPNPSVPPMLGAGGWPAQQPAQPLQQPAGGYAMPAPQPTMPLQQPGGGYGAPAQTYGAAAYGTAPADPYHGGYAQPAPAFDAYGNAIPPQQLAAMGGVPTQSYAVVPTTRHPQIPAPPLSDREQDVLRLLYQDGELGVTDISKYLEVAQSSVHNILEKLEQAALVVKGQNKKRRLTDMGAAVAQGL